MADDGKVIPFRAPTDVDITTVLGDDGYGEMPPTVAVAVASILTEVEAGLVEVPEALRRAAMAGYVEGWEDGESSADYLIEEAEEEEPSGSDSELLCRPCAG